MSFANRLEDFSNAVALVGEDGAAVSYADLARRADAFAAEHWGVADGHEAKRLVLLQMANTVPSVVRYLAALRAGHAVLLTGDDPHGKAAALVSRYRPDICVDEAGNVTRPHGRMLGGIVHPDLALCLSTSGSTGATKIVRLSHRALDANAASIAEYLELGPDERAISSLPLHYSYGLSVLHSHLACGAAVILTGRSVAEPEFWDIFRREQATSLAGVPHSFELLDRSGFVEMELASLRYVTQAGGRLDAEVVGRYGRWARETGRRFHVMYGQTEAAPRMAWLPPARLMDYPDSIGIAVPGGELTLEDEHGRVIVGDGIAGELVYRGENVMMGYAQDRADLARGAEVEALRTGDMAERRDGIYRIVGRKSRFCKPFGLRISLDELEMGLARRGIAAVATGHDGMIAIACRNAGDVETLAQELGREYGLPAGLFDISMGEEWPRLPSGKTDYPAILRAAEDRRRMAEPRESLLEAYAALLGRPALSPQDSFVSLEGDSLSYVGVANEIDRRLGYLPEGWETLTIAEIDTLQPRQAGGAVKPFDTEMLLRAGAITAVVANHASPGAQWHFGGGADILMLLAGFSLARFNFGRLVGGQGKEVLLSLLRRVILPYYLILLAYSYFSGDVSVPSLLLVSNFEGRFQSFLTPYWFMEALLQASILIVLLFTIAPVRRAAAAKPFHFGLWALGGALVLKVVAYAIFHHDYLQKMTPDAVLPLIAFGWLLFFARTPRQKAVTLLAGLGFMVLHLGVPQLGGWDFEAVGRHRLSALLAATIVLLYVPRLTLPVPVARWIGRIAAASFTIYLVHVVPVHVLRYNLHVGNVPLIVLAALAAGLAVHSVRPERLANFLQSRMALRRIATAASD